MWDSNWGFTIIRDPAINPQIVGFPYNKDPNRVPLLSKTPNNPEARKDPVLSVQGVAEMHLWTCLGPFIASALFVHGDYPIRQKSG